MPTTILQVHVLLKKEGPAWVAQCLEYDIAGQGKTIKDALYQAERALVGHAIICQEGGKAIDVPAAPQEYWRMFGQAEPLRDSPSDPFRPLSALPISIKPELRVGS